MRRLLLLLVALSLAGCGISPVGSEFFHQPNCNYRGDEGTALVVLMAQAVPSATQVPCVELLPSGWSVSDAFVRNGRARFTLSSDRVGSDAVQVALEQFCAFGGRVTRVPSDHPGTRRYQQIVSIEPRRYRGIVYYLFQGGCVTYRLDFRGDEQARPLGEVSLALGFVTRDALNRSVREFTSGRLQLDPPGAAR